jgi:uncharacterized protein YjiS (DUF1127 family)
LRNAAAQHEAVPDVISGAYFSSALKNESFPALAAGFERKASMFMAKLTGWFRMWSRYHQGVHELSQLSDRELADIGVTRSEIPAIAWHDAHR